MGKGGGKCKIALLQFMTNCGRIVSYSSMCWYRFGRRCIPFDQLFSPWYVQIPAPVFTQCVLENERVIPNELCHQYCRHLEYLQFQADRRLRTYCLALRLFTIEGTRRQTIKIFVTRRRTWLQIIYFKKNNYNVNLLESFLTVDDSTRLIPTLKRSI